MLPTMQRSKGMTAVRRNLQLVREVRQIEGDIHPILGIRKRTVRTNQGIRNLLVRKDLLHYVVVVELTTHKIVEHKS